MNNMQLVITDLLQSHSVMATITKMMNFAKNNEVETLKLMYLQFFIHRLGKNHLLTLDELQGWDEETELADLLREIFESVSSLNFLLITVK